MATPDGVLAERARIAVDIGGTFVDAIVFDPAVGASQLAKTATTPAAPSESVPRCGGLATR